MSWQLYVLSISPRLLGPDVEELVGSGQLEELDLPCTRPKFGGPM